MPDVLVTNRNTGEQRFIDSDQFDAEKFDLAADQVATVDPLGAGGEFAAGLEITPETLEAADPLQQVTAEARAALTREQVDEAVFDSTANTVEQSFRGVGSGLSFSLSELILRSGDPFERERQRRKRAQAPTAFAAGEIVGAVVPGLLTGGAGFVGTAARLTPAGRLSALSARVASRGTGLVQRVRSGIAGGAIEGAGQGVGTFLAREALQENPAFSAESLASAAGFGGLLGGVVGGAIPLLGAGAAKVQRLRGRRPPTLADLGVDDTAAFRALDEPVIAETVDFRRLVSPNARRQTGESFGDIITHVDDTTATASRAVADDVPALATRLDELGVDDALKTELTTAVRSAADDLARASERASLWTGRATRELGATPGQPLTAKLASKELPEQLDDLGADVFAELDDAGRRFVEVDQTVRQSLADAVQQADVQATTAPGLIQRGGLGERVSGISNRIRQSLASRSGALETAGTVLGAAEVARDVGGIDIPTARDIPGIGTAVSLWARWKAGGNALRKVGLLPSSGVARAAAGVNTVRGKLEAFASRAARGVAVRATSPLAKRLAARSATKVATEIADIRGRSSAQVAQEVANQVGTQAPEMAAAAGAAAARAHQYLVDQAPQNPLTGTILEQDWQPTSLQAKQWATTVAAVRDPIGAIEASLSAPYPDSSISAVEAVYPAIFAETQQRMTLEADRLRKRLPRGRLQALGRVFRIPLTISQQPTYLPSLTSSSQAMAQPARPRASTTSPLGTLDLTAEQSRQISR